MRKKPLLLLECPSSSIHVNYLCNYMWLRYREKKILIIALILVQNVNDDQPAIYILVTLIPLVLEQKSPKKE